MEMKTVKDKYCKMLVMKNYHINLKSFSEVFSNSKNKVFNTRSMYQKLGLDQVNEQRKTMC